MSQEEIQYREQVKTLQQNMINMCLELINLLRLAKRLGYYCPIEYVSEPFFILYACHKQRVEALKQDLIMMLDDDGGFSQATSIENKPDADEPKPSDAREPLD